MKIKYTITSVSNEDFAAKAKVGEREVDVKIPGLVLEMTSADGSMGHTFRVLPEDGDSTDEFVVGATVIASLDVA